MIEIWRPVVGFEGLYEVSSWGRVKRLAGKRCRQERILKPALLSTGYLGVDLYKDEKRKNCSVHRLVAKAFIPNPDNLPQVNHRDENKENNHVENLEWITAKKNCNYRTRNERIAKAKSLTVYQFTLNGDFVKEWPSTNEVKRQTGWSTGNISQCCLGKRKSAYHYKWSYSKD